MKIIKIEQVCEFTDHCEYSIVVSLQIVKISFRHFLQNGDYNYLHLYYNNNYNLLFIKFLKCSIKRWRHVQKCVQ